MIKQLLKEIDACIQNNCFYTALMAALTIPDACGKIEYYFHLQIIYHNQANLYTKTYTY